ELDVATATAGSLPAPERELATVVDADAPIDRDSLLLHEVLERRGRLLVVQIARLFRALRLAVRRHGFPPGTLLVESACTLWRQVACLPELEIFPGASPPRACGQAFPSSPALLPEGEGRRTLNMVA